MCNCTYVLCYLWYCSKRSADTCRSKVSADSCVHTYASMGWGVSYSARSRGLRPLPLYGSWLCDPWFFLWCRDILFLCCESLVCDSSPCAPLVCDSLVCDYLLCFSLVCDSFVCDSLLCGCLPLGPLVCDSLVCDSLLCDSLVFNMLPGSVLADLTLQRRSEE